MSNTEEDVAGNMGYLPAPGPTLCNAMTSRPERAPTTPSPLSPIDREHDTKCTSGLGGARTLAGVPKRCKRGSSRGGGANGRDRGYKRGGEGVGNMGDR